MRLYFEQEMHEQTVSSVDAFRHYLKSEKLIDEGQKTAHYEFLNFVCELTRLKSEGIRKKDTRTKILSEQIRQMQSNPLGVKNWLLEKVIELG